MQKVKSILRQWLPIAIVTTAFCGLVYLTVQQVLRQDANDPQIQMAEDAAQAISRGVPIGSILPSNQVDLSKSLAPFIMVFDASGTPLASSGQLHGQIPVIPVGVFEYVRTHDEDRITWQPESGVRIASVIVSYTGTQSGFVLAGRSLREIEIREDQVATEAGIVWIVTLLGSLIMVAFGQFYLSNIKRNN